MNKTDRTNASPAVTRSAPVINKIIAANSVVKVAAYKPIQPYTTIYNAIDAIFEISELSRARKALLRTRRRTVKRV